MHYSIVTNKGQTTIPADIREKMNIMAGDKLEFINHGNYIAIIPINKSVIDLKNLVSKSEISLSCSEIDKIIKGSL